MLLFKNNLPYVLSDMDGTISLPDFSILEETKKDIVNYQKKSGYRFSIITGRDWIVNKEIIHDLKIQLPVVSCDGALITDPNSNEILDVNYIDKECAINIFRKSQSMGLDVIAYTTNSIVGTPTSDRVQAWGNYRKKITNKKYQFDIVVYDDLNKLADAIANNVIQPIELVVMANNKEQEDLMRTIFAQHNDKLDLVQSQPYMFKAIKKGVNKGTALKKWAEIVNVDPTNVAVFGDNYNDISMFDVSTNSYAVGNAVDKLKEKANKVIDTINNNGVGKQLESILKNDNN